MAAKASAAAKAILVNVVFLLVIILPSQDGEAHGLLSMNSRTNPHPLRAHEAVTMRFFIWPAASRL